MSEWPESALAEREQMASLRALSKRASGGGPLLHLLELAWDPKLASNSVIAMAQNIEKSLQDAIPGSLSPPSLSRPPIRLVYSRRQRFPVGFNQTPTDTDQGMAFGSQQRLDKRKGLLFPDTPSIKNFIQATSDGKLYAELTIGQIQHTAIRYCGLCEEQVGVGKLMAPVRDNVKLIPGRSSSTRVDDAVGTA
ncbi:hypothetical protein GUJ93_ZPchr0006g43149 [Zizania palustris]|uniref:Uncharacterized protein n=1 Tax=Zizania palustris TaxID=103762 RepID=A0A8J5W3Q2_ZIZPA|nr:hypothetical protein GUJ93_ZPchr0006g43149 [Zizania palustris]